MPPKQSQPTIRSTRNNRSGARSYLFLTRNLPILVVGGIIAVVLVTRGHLTGVGDYSSSAVIDILELSEETTSGDTPLTGNEIAEQKFKVEQERVIVSDESDGREKSADPAPVDKQDQAQHHLENSKESADNAPVDNQDQVPQLVKEKIVDPTKNMGEPNQDTPKNPPKETPRASPVENPAIDAFDSLETFYDPFTNTHLPKKLDKGIRSWGCNRTEAPLVFVHVGKAGGGHVRARFAAGVLGYNRTRGWWAADDDGSYYPMQHPITGESVQGHYCTNPGHNHRLPSTVFQPKSIDGTFICNASTPIANAIACPDLRVSKIKRCQGCSDVDGEACFTVYCFHSLLGNEMHWLPSRFLQRWWNASTWSSHDLSVASALTTIERGKKEWCPAMNASRPETKRELLKTYDKCNGPMGAQWDEWMTSFWKKWQGDDKIVNYGPIYASLPMHRTTVLREPFSWIMSKFFWHGYHVRVGGYKNCTDLVEASRSNYPDYGWGTRFALEYMFYLCGDDCMNRYEKGEISLAEIEAQAEYNLRYSFSIVGFLEESDQFHRMVSTRVSYINMLLNPEVMGRSHSTGKKKEDMIACREKFKEPDFQKAFIEASPEMAAVARLHKVAKEVNAFQYDELKKCPGTMISEEEAGTTASEEEDEHK